MVRTSREAVTNLLVTLSEHTYPVMRFGLGGTMIAIGMHKVFRPLIWASYLAPFFKGLIGSAGVSGTLFMQATGIGEILLGLLLIANVTPVLVSGILTLFMLGIIANLLLAGIQFSIILRDMGIFVLCLATTLHATAENITTQKER